jgi:BMFP domain-containing protein YqiC
MANDIFSTLRTYLTKVTDGDTKATEVASAVNQWLREGGEALKVKIEDEVERSVSKMGFVKRGEFEALKEELARLKVELKNEGATKSATKKAATKDSTAKKAAPKKAAVKKAASKKASK